MRLFNHLSQKPWIITEESGNLLMDVYTEAMSRKASGEKLDWQMLAQKRGIPIRDTMRAEIRENGVAILNVTGPIFRRADWFTEMCGVCSTETLAKDFYALQENPEVRAIIINIDSPGGEASGLFEFGRQVYNARDNKPMVAYCDGMAASGGYLIACSAGKIYTDRIGALGSIGVVTQVVDYSEADAKLGIKTYKFRSRKSPKKNLGVEEEGGKDAIQIVLDDICDVFLSDVALYRSIDGETVTAAQVAENYGEGGIMIGKRAKNAGLADAMGDLESLVISMGKEADKKFGKRTNPTVLDEQGRVKTVATIPAKAENNTENSMAKINEENKPAESADAIDETKDTPKDSADNKPAQKPEDKPANEASENKPAESSDDKEEETVSSASNKSASAMRIAEGQSTLGKPVQNQIAIDAGEYQQLLKDRAEKERVQTELRTEKATTQASTLIRDGRLDPAKKPNVATFLNTLMGEDLNNPVSIAIAFDAEGKPAVNEAGTPITGNRVAAFLACLPDAGTQSGSTMTAETIPSNVLEMSSYRADEDANKVVVGDTTQAEVDEAVKGVREWATQSGLVKEDKKAA